MAHPAEDRNLLVGVIALRMNFASKDQVVTCMQDWFAHRSKPLNQILSERGFIDAPTEKLLDKLADHQLQLHHGDAQESISAISASDMSGLEAFGIGVPTSLVEPSELTISINGLPEDDRQSRYRVLRKHAVGGLGEVYVAEDMELHREVALKEIQPKHAKNIDSRERFVLEAEITGGLEHPGVVPVYGFNCHPDGRPYYAMRFIKGETLKEAIKRFHQLTGDRTLALRGLLTRFVAVCQTLAYAHSRGVVHRDLKPSNIMLGKFGETIIVDWGLAKAVGREKTKQSATELQTEPTLHPGSGSAVITEVGKVMGTPAFMSPEQAAGDLDNQSPASDVYSLGCTLYTLLVGQAPFDGAVESVLDKVKRGDFPPPRAVSTTVAPGLEAICLKAMTLKPTDRYATAVVLAEEIESWLADEPVRAWSEPFSARAWRWMRRHRTAMVGTGVLLATAAVGLGISTALIYREQQHTKLQEKAAVEEWTRAEDNLKLARQMTSTLLEMADAKLLPGDPRNIYNTRREITLTALKTYDKFLKERPADPELQAETARVYRYAAKAHQILSDWEKARELEEESVRLFEAASVAMPADKRIRNQFAETLRDLSQILGPLGRLGRATQALQKSLEIATELQALDSKELNYSRTKASSLLDLSGVDHATGRHKDALQHSEMAANLYGEILKKATDNNAFDELLFGAALNRWAVALRELDQQKAAISKHHAAITHLEAASAARPRSGNYLHTLARTRLEFAKSQLLFHENPETVLAELKKAIESWRGLVRNPVVLPDWNEWYSEALVARAGLYLSTQRYDDATADLLIAQPILEKLSNEAPTTVDWAEPLGRVHWLRSKLQRQKNDPEAATKSHAEAITVLTAALQRAPMNKTISDTLNKINSNKIDK